MLSIKEIKDLDTHGLVKYLLEREKVFAESFSRRVEAQRDEEEAIKHLDIARREIRFRLQERAKESEQ